MDLEKVFNEKGITCLTCKKSKCKCKYRNEDGTWWTGDSNVNWYAFHNTNSKRNAMKKEIAKEFKNRKTKIYIGGKYICDLKDIKKRNKK